MRTINNIKRFNILLKTNYPESTTFCNYMILRRRLFVAVDLTKNYM